MASRARGVLDNDETTYHAGHVFPQKIRVMPGGDTDAYGNPNEREVA